VSLSGRFLRTTASRRRASFIKIECSREEIETPRLTTDFRRHLAEADFPRRKIARCANRHGAPFIVGITAQLSRECVAQLRASSVISQRNIAAELDEPSAIRERERENSAGDSRVRSIKQSME